LKDEISSACAQQFLLHIMRQSTQENTHNQWNLCYCAMMQESFHSWLLVGLLPVENGIKLPQFSLWNPVSPGAKSFTSFSDGFYKKCISKKIIKLSAVAV
jgi:hypothetical protein